MKKIKRNRRAWTEEDSSLLKKLVNENESVHSIAEAMGRGEETIKNMCNLHRLTPKKIHNCKKPNTWSGEDEKNLRELQKQNVGIKVTVATLGYSECFIAKKIKELGIHNLNSKSLKEAKALSRQGLRECCTCNEVKPKNSFYKQMTECLSCSKERRNKWRLAMRENSSVEKILRNRLSTSKTSSKLRYPDFDFNIDIEYLLDLYNQQDGKCFYSGRKMLLKKGYWETVSIDRIDSSQGYIKGNVNLVCAVINFMKTDLPHEGFIEIAHSIAKKHPLKSDVSVFDFESSR